MSDPRMSILHVVECYGGGVATFLGYVLPAQVQRGHEVHLICSPRPGVDRHVDLDGLRRAGVDVQVIPMSRSFGPWRDLSAWRAIRRCLKRLRIDVIHTHGLKAGILGRFTRVARDAAIVHTPHCLAFARCSSRLVRWGPRLVEQRLARCTDAMMFVSASEFQSACASGIVPAGVGRVIPNALGTMPTPSPALLASLRNELRLPDGNPIVGTCCRLVPYKGVDQFIRCARSLLEWNPALIFVVLGEGPQRARIEAGIAASGISQSVRLPGHRADALAIMSMMNVLVLCSLAEGMPFAVLEAMSQGVPVVASDVPGNRDVVSNRVTGLLYRYGDVRDLERCVRECLQDAGLRARLVSGARHQIATAHRLDQQLQAILNLYRQAVSAALARRGANPALVSLQEAVEVNS